MGSSESVNEGHPNKLCSRRVLEGGPQEQGGVRDRMQGQHGDGARRDHHGIEARLRRHRAGAVKGIGYDSFVDDLGSAESKGLSCKSCEVLVRINKQSPDIAGGVHVGKSDLDVGAGDQGIMFGYASDETEVCMPLTHLLATLLGKKLTDVRKSGHLWWLRPDGRTQVTIEYKQHADGSVEPLKIHTVVISTQHAEPSKAVRSKEVGGYEGPEATAPSMAEMNNLIVKEVIEKCLAEIKLKVE